MTWLSPGAAIAAAAALVPLLVLLYFLKLRRRDVEVSSTFLWKKSIQDMQANAPFQKLRRNLLLLLQLLVLAAGLLAIAQPELSAPQNAQSRHILVIDRSASMRAIDAGADGGESRLEAAKQQAVEYVDALREPGIFGVGARDEAMVIAFDSGAQVIQPWTSDKARLRSAVESITPTDAPTFLDEAIRLSGAYAQPALVEQKGLVSQATAPIHVWSDGRVQDAMKVLLPTVTPMTYHRVGKADAVNVGIVALRADRDFDQPGKISIFVGLETTAAVEQTVDVELAIDGLVTGIRSAPMSAATDESVGTGGVVFTLDRVDGGLARIRLTEDDALAVDNVAHLALAPAKRLAVALVTNGDLYLETALEGLTLSKFVKYTPGQYESAAASGELPEFDVVVMSGWAPDEPLLPGRYLIFGAAPEIRGLKSSGRRDGPFVAIDWSREHPMFRFASLGNLVIARDVGLEPSDDLRVLARSDAGPIAVDATDQGVRAIVVSFEPAESNWPFDPGFVLATASAVRALGDAGGAVTTPSATPGQTVSTRVPTTVRQVTLHAPGGAERTLRPDADGVVTFGPAARTGVYQLTWSGPGGATDLSADGRSLRVIAVNLLDPAESDVRSEPTLELASRRVESAAGGGEVAKRQQLWPWLLVAALAMLLLEWFFYNKRVAV